MLCLYILCKNCLHLTFLPYLSSETYFRIIYEKLPNIVIHACKHNQNKWICWKCVARKFGYVYLHFDTLSQNSEIAWLQSIMSVDSVMQITAFALGARGHVFNYRLLQRFCLISFVLLLLLCFYLLSQNTLFVIKFCNSFYNVNIFSILNIL